MLIKLLKKKIKVKNVTSAILLFAKFVNFRHEKMVKHDKCEKTFPMIRRFCVSIWKCFYPSHKYFQILAQYLWLG